MTQELINSFSWKARMLARQNLSLKKKKCGKVVDLTYFKMSFFEGKKKNQHHNTQFFLDA